MDIKISSLNDPPRLLSGPQLLHDMIRWDKHENSCAIDFTSHDKREKYLYKDIQACVASLFTRIKSALRRNQIPQQQQHIVPILLPQSPGLYISQLAILQSGGAFCPINLDAPKDRIRFVAGDISASIIITTSEFQELVSWQDGPKIIIVDEFPAIPTNLEDISESRVPESNDLAYVMYTSGSSGTPKGVAVSHLAASQSLLAHEILIPKFERFLQFAAPSFDVSVFEIFFPLTRGQTLVGCDRSQLLNDLPGMINELEIDAVELTPTVVGALLQKRAYVPKLKLLMTIGEMLTRPIVEEFGGSITKDSLLYGMYGPTEAAIHCTIHPKMEANAKPGNIGVPFDTVSAFIAESATGPGKEQDLRFLPQGELGELILGGPQLANGYLNREEQNKAAFVTMGDKSYYRTGDKGRILADGSIEIHGRMSGGQVKLRGQRVELDEVEDAVYKHGGIKTVVAVVLSGVLIVFALTDDDTMNSGQVLRTCSQWLPKFMVPSEIVLLQELPYLPSGKVDKRRLEANYQQQREGDEDLTNLTQTEVTVREVLRDVLGPFTSNIRLAAAGLDSLVSIRVSRELRLRGLHITTLAVLQAETLSSLVKLCQSCSETPNSTTMKVAISNLDPHAMLNGDANDIEISYPCTPLQNAMLAETALDQRAYRNWIELDLPGITNIDYLRTNLHQLTHHNPILRTGFAESSDNSGYMQFVWKSFPDSHIEKVDAFARDLDISKNASLHHPIRFKILSTKSCLKLLIHIHHALYDAWSLDLILDDLDCLLRDETPISRPQFTEVVSGYIDGRLSSDSQPSKDYWKDHMAHLELRCMPNFHPRKVSSARLVVAHHLTELSTLDIEVAAKRMASSPQAIFQAAYSLILASYLGSTDVCFGTVFSGRTLPIAGIEDIIGPCLATLPIRIDISTASTLQDLVEELNSTNRKHLEYSTVPLREIKSVNGFEPRQQLFDTLLIWQQTLHSYDHSRQNVLLVNQADQLEFNLTLEITPTSNTIHFKANYQQSVFPESQIDMLLRQLEAATKAIIENAENSPKNAFNECGPGILSIENPTPSLRFGPETLISPVERIAKEDPDRSAVAFASKIDDDNSVIQYLSYGALNNRANKLGHYLSYHGVLQDDIICICLEKSHDFYASILAIAKVGAGYLPLTPDTPRDRLQHILHEANVKILIGNSVSRPILENFAEQDIIYIDEIDLSHQSAENFTSVFKPENISYCVFTSGSTGTPKGVLITQGNLLSNLDVLVEIYPASRDSKLLQACSQAFDVSVFEIFFTWRIGGCLCSAVKDVLFRDIELAIRVMGVTHLSLTPTVAALIDPQKVPKVKFLVTAGEAVTQKVFNKWAGRGLYQGYGPSETTNICTVKPRVTLDDRIDNIGLPFTNTSTFVLARDKEFSLVPRGGEGEFCFGGSQVFRGYINRAQQEGNIIDHPKYGRLYKSGDFGRLMPDGSLVFTGRKDDQVKIRGQRVELGEINNLLISLPDVEDCVTMVINGKGNSQRLVCFFITGPNASESMIPLSVDPIMVSSLYQALESKLPSYMVPSNLIPVSILPSTSQGKIDKRRLISLHEDFELQYPDSTTRASKPSIDHQWTELELSIRSILGEISQSPVEDIGPDASFFAFGIDSISAIAFSRKLRQVITKHINISDILNHSTVVRLAEHLSKCQEIEEGDISLVDKKSNIPAEFIESTISQFSKMGRTAERVTACTPLQEAMLSAGEFSLGASYSNHTIFNIFGDLERLRGCWQEMVERHEILRTCFVSTDIQDYPYVQVVLKNFEVEFGHLDSSTLEDAVFELERLSTDNKNTPRYSINTLQADGEQRLLLSMHHALYDGVALSVLYDEVEKLYHGLPLPTMVSFTPFLQHMSTMDIQSSDKFWESTLQGYHQLHLEDISDKPNQFQNNNTRVQRLVAKTSLSQIEKKIKKHSTTPLAVFHAAWAACMSELLKTTDICFGNVVSGRTAPVDGIERLVAPCFNTIPTRLVDVHKSTYLEAFRKLQNANANSLAFQFTPLRRLQSKFSPDGSRLFDTLFILQQPSKDLDSSIWSIVEDNGAMDFPLVCEIIPKPNNDTIEIAFHSSTSIFSDKDAYNLIQKFENILETALNNPRRQIMSSFVREQITTKSEARERDAAGEEGQNKVMSRLESEIRDVIAGFSDIPLQKIGRDTSIFRLGLDSISTVQVASRLRSQGHNLLASDVLQHPTIARVASYLESNMASKSEENSQFDFVAFYQKYCERICSKLAIQYENIEAIRPCTAVQQGMLAQSLHSDGHEYINSMSLELLKSHSITEVRDAWIKVCKAHEMLRTIFAQTEDPNYPFVMVTFTKDSFEIPWFESREQAPSKGIDRLVNPWDMSVDQKDNKTLLIFTAHHALYDAQSMQIIFSDFTKLYHFQAVASRPSINTLLSSVLQASKGAQDEKRAFWEQPENRIVVNKFPDLTPLRVTAPSNAVRELKSQASLKGLEDRCRELGVTMQAAGQATWARLLMAYTGENATTFGMTLSGRSVCDDANMVAFPTIVTLPVSCNVMGSNSELLSRTMISNAQLHKHQFTPLTSIQKWSGYPEGKIFDTLFAYQKLPDEDDEGMMSPPWKVVDEKASVDYAVSLEVQPTQSGEITIRLSFRQDIVPTEHAELIVKQFDALLLDTLKNPNHPCSVAPEVEIDLLSITPAQDPVLSDSVTLLHQYVERGAKTWPDKFALEFSTCLEPGNYQSQKWTYKQLDEEANRVAQIIYKRGATPGEIIAICFDKCAEASFAIIGIMKAGCGYVALDPNAPADRLKFIVEDSAAKLIITAGNPAQTLRTFVDGEMIDLTDPAVLAESTHEMPQLLRDITPQDISYCLYTSGTTGTPKGCLLTHENTIQAMLAFQRLFDGHWTTDSKWLQFASFHFDVSVLEQFWSWSVGICVASAPRDLIFEDIPGAIQQLGITHIDLTPSLARLLHPDDVPSLCKGVFITGGEQLKQEILDVWGEHACIYNGYGPTEATIGVTMYPRVPKNGKPSNIGPQFDNVGSFVLKPGTELPVLRGGIGELCVSGKLVGKGYLNRPELTTERFPTLSNFKERVYRTGDLVRILHDGTFIFLGRADDQVKLRGQRLELGEINEVTKKSRGDLEEVVTLVLKHKAQAKEQLVTFFVTSGKNESEGSGVVPLIRDACISRLPGYMVPTHFISIKALPLNANNKADSKQLAAIFNGLNMEDLQNMSLSEQSHATWTENEHKVVKNIARLFPVEVPQLTQSSNIFQLGIDSITMVTFSQSLRNCGYVNATNVTVRSNPTIGRLVEALLDSKPDESKKNLYLAAAKQNIAGFSQQHTMAICKELGVSIEQIECIAPCTPVQEGMIFRFLESDSLLYFNRIQYGLKTGVCFEELAAACDRVVSRLQILRTKFVSTNDGFAQVVLKSVESSRIRTPKGLNKSDMLKMPWSLEKSGLKFQEKLILNIFHGLYDGNSLGMILNHLSDEFHHAPNIQYGPDFHSSLAYGPLAIVPGAEAFWKSHLRTWSPYVLPHNSKDHGDFVYAGTLDLENFEDTRKALSVTPQAIIQAAWIAALQLTISPNLTTIGIVTSGRTIDFEEVENVAGPLFNTVPFHLPIQPGTQISSLVAECHSINMKAQEFQHTSLKDIRKWVSAGMSGPLFDTIFAFQRPDINEERFSNSLGRETGVIDEIALDYPLALEATLNHSNTKLSFQIVGKSSAVPEYMARILAAELTMEIEAILRGERKEIKVDSAAVYDQPEFVPSSSSEPPIFSSPDQDVLSDLTKQQQDVICSEIAILAKLDEIHIHEPRSIFELGLDSIDVIKLSSRLRKNEIEISVSGIIKCQTVIKILENANTSKSKLRSSPSMEELRKISKRLENYLKPSLPPNYERVFPATPLQEGILKEMVQSNFRRYFTVHVFQLSTWTQEEKLMRAVDHVIENSPILRTTFLEVHDPQSPANYAQIVGTDWEKATKAKVLAGHDSWSLEQLLQGAEDRLRGAWASIDKHTFGIVPVHFGAKRFMMMAISHALYDGGSLPMIHDDIRKAYYGYELPKRPDYVSYIAEAFYSTSDEANEFWKATLWNSQPSVFPKQEPPPKHESVTHRHEKPSAFSLQEVKSFCSSSNITLQTLGQTCWAFVLAELMGQLDVVFGAVLACRDTTEAGQVNFPLFNTVAVRSVIRGTLDQMLRDMQERSVTTRQFQHFPLRKAQAYALGCRNASTKDSTLFDTLFTYQGARPSEEIDPLYSSIGGSSGVELAICVEMEIEDESDRLYWTAACKSEARNLQQTKDIIANLDMILGRILKHTQEQAIMIRPDGISLCGFRTFQPLGINSTQKPPLRYTRFGDWSEIELKLRESISVISGLPEEDILGDSTIFQLGLDSITVLKLPALLKKHHIELTASEIMKYLTIRDIANHLSEKQAPQQETVIDVDAILAESTSWITQPHLDRLQASLGRIEYTMPATAGQRYMIRRWQVSQGSLFYARFKFKLPNGHVHHPHLLDFAWFKLQCQHDILRTGFTVSDTESRIAQIVYRDPSNKIIYATKLPRLEEWARFWDIRNLEEPPLRIFGLVDSSESGTLNRGVELHLIIHHALYDGISISLLVNNLKAWYEDSYSMSQASSELSVPRASWRTFVATAIREKNKQSVKDRWVGYLGSVDGNGYFDSPWKVNAGNEDTIRTEVFIPGIEAKRLKSLARLQGVSVDHILIVMASKLFGMKRLKSDSDAQSPPESDTDIIVGLYLANRFPFSHNLSQVLAPTLNLLPIKVNVGLPDEESVKGVQRDLGEIGEGGMANVGLDEIYEWTGVRVNGWINIVKSVDGDPNENAENGKEKPNPGSEHGVRKEEEREDEIPRPIVDREGYMRLVASKRNLRMKAVEDCGAYVSSIDLEFRYHPDTEELDLGIFGPESMITLDEARHWHELLQHQV